jgi:adenine-specific DNA-methyltransferase
VLTAPGTPRKLFSQYMTPAWAAQELIDRHFADLTPADFVIEPSCGRGAFLQAIPEAVPALGVEIDPALAAEAERLTGRAVVVGDFRWLALPPATVIVGNPPFVATTIEAFLHRAAHLLPLDGRCGLILPAYVAQTPRRVMGWAATWSLLAEVLPRTLFQRARLPLLFVLFRKARLRTMVGFALFQEAQAFDNVGEAAKRLLVAGGRRGVWRTLVEDTLQRLGGCATLAALYHAIEPRRPTPNAFWREKVRQTLQLYCRPVARGEWAMPE